MALGWQAYLTPDLGSFFTFFTIESNVLGVLVLAADAATAPGVVVAGVPAAVPGLYTLFRGPLVNWYPYPFLDPRPHGYGPAVVVIVGVAVGFVAATLPVRWAGTTLGRRLVPGWGPG